MWRSLALCVIVLAGQDALATDRHFWDLSERSPGGEFRLDAKSPDNVEAQTPANEFARMAAFQARFVYTCTEAKSGKILWSRKQAMSDSVRVPVEGGPEIEVFSPGEPSPVMVRISDTGRTVILLDSDDLVVVRPDGTDAGKVDLRRDGFTEEERERYVHRSTAGPFWGSLSAWYFLKTGEEEYFVVRPWWGRRLIIDLKRGRLADADEPRLAEAAKDREVALAIGCLKAGADAETSEMSLWTAAHLAGVLEIREAIPRLRSLEARDEIGSSTLGSLSKDIEFQNEVDPHTYSEFTLRKISQLSLRRLGERPGALPCYRFQLRLGDEQRPFSPAPVSPGRHENASRVKEGMPAKDILLLLGSPDFIDGDDWSYDMDGPEPFSLTLTFGPSSVTKIKRDLPLWKTGGARDESLTR